MPDLLQNKQVQTFYDQGFVELPGFFKPEQVDALADACDRVYACARALVEQGVVCASQLHPVEDGARFTFQPGDGGDFDLRHVAWCGNGEPVFDQLGRDPKMLALVGDLMDCREASQLINQVHYKKPGSAVAFDWHQDAYHRGIDRGTFVDVLGNGSYVQVAVAIDDVLPDAGPLGFIPGSNRHGFLGALYRDGAWACERVDPADAVYPLLKRGDAMAFGPYTVHGSSANRSANARRTFINGFAAPGADHKPPKLPNEGRILNLFPDTRSRNRPS